MGIKFSTREKRDKLAERLATLAKHMRASLDQGANHKILVTDEMIEDIQVAAVYIGLSDIKESEH